MKCKWEIYDSDNRIFMTECGELHEFIEGGIEENEYKFCPYCGGEILGE